MEERQLIYQRGSNQITSMQKGKPLVSKMCYLSQPLRVWRLEAGDNEITAYFIVFLVNILITVSLEI